MTAEQVRKIRRKRRWTQREMAERLGVTEFTVSRWERERHRPSPVLVRALRILRDGL